jgi:hypothetical protein
MERLRKLLPALLAAAVGAGVLLVAGQLYASIGGT